MSGEDRRCEGWEHIAGAVEVIRKRRPAAFGEKDTRRLTRNSPMMATVAAPGVHGSQSRRSV